MPLHTKCIVVVCVTVSVTIGVCLYSINALLLYLLLYLLLQENKYIVVVYLIVFVTIGTHGPGR